MHGQCSEKIFNCLFLVSAKLTMNVLEDCDWWSVLSNLMHLTLDLCKRQILFSFSLIFVLIIPGLPAFRDHSYYSCLVIRGNKSWIHNPWCKFGVDRHACIVSLSCLSSEKEQHKPDTVASLIDYAMLHTATPLCHIDMHLATHPRSIESTLTALIPTLWGITAGQPS